MDKVGLSDLDTGRILGADEQIELSAARHEYEGFQLVLTPLPGAAENVSIRVGDLAGEAVADRFRPRRSRSTPSVTSGSTPAPTATLVPDPLLIGAIPRLKVGENQPVWISVHVPPDAKAGDYRGTISIASPGARTFTIPLHLRMRDFDIPKKISLRSSFWIFRDQINRFYHLDEIALDDYFQWIDFALQHRVNPIDVFEGHCDPLLDISLPRQKWDMQNTTHVGTPNPKPDFTKWDQYLDRMVVGGANTLNLGTTHHFGSFFKPDAKSEGAPRHVERVRQAVAIMAGITKSATCSTCTTCNCGMRPASRRR